MSLALCSALPVLAQAVNTTPSPRDQKYGLFGKKAKKSGDLRNMHGRVLDSAGAALSGATVQLNEPSGGNIRNVISGKDGSFRFDDLSLTQDYQLQAVYKDRSSQRRTISQYDARQSLSVELRLEQGQKTEKP